MRDLRLTRSRRGLVVALLVLALLAAQALGLAHRAVHGPGRGHGHDHGPSAVAASAAHEPSAFDTHEPGSAECRLIDQAAHLDVLIAAATTAMPPRVPDLRPSAAEEDTCSGSGCAYLARGPPGPVDEGRQRLG